MASFSRYSRTPLLNLGEQFGTSDAIWTIRQAISAGTVKTRTIVLRGAERLDTIAGSVYGDGRLWWLIAAASDIGWGMQVPPGTVLKLPDLSDVAALVA